MRFLLKNSNLASVFVSDVLVDGEDEHEDEEEASTAKKVPEVVSEVRNLYICRQQYSLYRIFVV